MIILIEFLINLVIPVAYVVTGAFYSASVMDEGFKFKTVGQIISNILMLPFAILAAIGIYTFKGIFRLIKYTSLSKWWNKEIKWRAKK